MCLCTVAQDVTLTFTGRDENNNYLQLNRVVATNFTKGWQENILWPDTTLMVQNVTANKNNTENCGLEMSQNYPNPFSGTTEVNLSVEEAGNVTIETPIDEIKKLYGSKPFNVNYTFFKEEIGTEQPYKISTGHKYQNME